MKRELNLLSAICLNRVSILIQELDAERARQGLPKIKNTEVYQDSKEDMLMAFLNEQLLKIDTITDCVGEELMNEFPEIIDEISDR